ncbi:MAG TPA: SDR family NAD(P)-dependent oxidoreductase [Caulobacteraceae bacterium]|jgi:3-oxoacyl-[acyl-carrier protein] reductase|nr:SDR family NAD(P)-dependent oxidoreductase [Caulobacteraceae bacterium]
MSDPARDFAGRVALVTGGSRGIGAGTALALASRGAKVVVTGRDEAALASVVQSIRRAGGEAAAFAADLTQAAPSEALRVAARTAFGPPQLLVACAGGGGALTPLVDESLDNWRATLDRNLTTAFLTLRAFLPAMYERGQGSVVLMSSSAGRHISGASAPYTAAKAGLQALMRQAASEAGPRGVRINAIAPSAIVTERLAAQPPSVREQIAKGFPLGRLGEVEDVVAATLFLLSDAAGWITGVTLDVAGGRVMV